MNETKNMKRKYDSARKRQIRFHNSLRWYWKIVLKRRVDDKNPHPIALRPILWLYVYGNRFLLAHEHKYKQLWQEGKQCC